MSKFIKLKFKFLQITNEMGILNGLGNHDLEMKLVENLNHNLCSYTYE